MTSPTIHIPKFLVLLTCFLNWGCGASSESFRAPEQSTIFIRSVRNIDSEGFTTIVGVVYDSTGFAMGGTNIDLISPSSGNTAKTTYANVGSTFILSYVSPGTYHLRASLVGFSDAMLPNLQIKANTTILLEIYLQPKQIEVH